jgi:serine/threonine protein phosphatase PrpC
MQEEVQIISASISDRGLSEKRPQNEDSYLELRESGLFAVADGVGGAQAGDVASQMAMEILAEAFINLQEDGDAETRMRLAIERANAAIFQMSHDLPQLSSMATTVVALHLNGNVATIGHVGDSRLYRLAPNGDLFQETLDHSVVEEEVRAGRMTPEQAAVHPSRNVISRALGAEPLVEIDLKTIAVEPNTMFIACSDGVTRHIDDHELRNLLIQAPDADSLCETIKEICYERGAEDNLTAVVVRIDSPFAEEFVGSPFTDSAEEETIATARDAEADRADGEFGSEEAPEAVFSENGSLPVERTPDSEADTDEFEALTDAADVSEAAPPDGISMKPSGNESFLSILSEGSPGKGPGDAGSAADEAETGARVGMGVIGKIFVALVLLLAGAVAGGAAVYFLRGAEQPVVIQPSPVTQKIPLTTFEQAKAEVYKNPAAAIATLSANPQNSEDLYFLGLAYVLNARYEEAGLALKKARDQLPEFDEDQRPNLAKEIAFAMTLVENPAAREAFENAVKTADQPSAPADANSNVSATPAG